MKTFRKTVGMNWISDMFHYLDYTSEKEGFAEAELQIWEDKFNWPNGPRTEKYLDSMFIEVKFNKRNSYYLDGEKITFENLYRRITA